MENNDRCFCELAPLYALDLLDETDRLWVEEQAEIDDDLSKELAELTASVDTLPYSLPPMSISADVKGRLFDRLGLEPPRPSTPEFIAPITVRPEELDWRPYRVPGVVTARLYIDEVNRQVVGVLKADPHVQYPIHRHREVEEIYMLEGDLKIGDQVYGPGSYIRSLPGSIHAPSTVGGCMFFVRTSLDDEYF